MKKIIKKGLVLVVAFITMVSYGNEISNNINNGSSNVTNLTFENVKKGSLLLIKDLNGLVLYKELIKINGDYSKGFDLTQLPNGDYFFELNKEFDITIIPFKVDSNIVSFNKTAEKKIFKPFVFVKNSKVFINKMSLNNDYLDIHIYDNNNEIVFSETIKKENGRLGRIYDFSTSKRGTYIIITKTNERRFVNKVQI